jgi:hypothetical protein
VTALLALLQGLWPALRSYWSYGALAVVSLLAWHFDARAIANADAVRTQASQFKQAQADATVIAQQALQTETTQYAAKAKVVDDAYQQQIGSARDAADRYIASHSVRPTAVASAPGSAPSATQSGNPDVPASVPANTVLVPPGDVQACTDAVTYAVKAHDWAATINP